MSHLDAQDRKFLGTYARTGDLWTAARVAKISLAVHHQRLETDPAYRNAFEAAQEQAVDLLEAEAFRRALAGSDELLMFLLRAWRPGRYGEQYDTARESARGRRPIPVDREWVQ